MALTATEYRENGWVKDSASGGALAIVTYDAGDAATYYTTQGLLRDADGRLVVAAAS